MRLLFLGDIVGRSGRDVVEGTLPDLIDRLGTDFVVVNVENAAAGFGITEKICRSILDAGADVLTSGNHVWDQKEALVFIERVPELLRPMNFPQGTPGRGADLFETRNGARIMVINLMGRLFMDALDDPFARIDQALDGLSLGTDAAAILVDFHAEATSEKMAMGHYLDGRVSCVIGTHTHVPTSDVMVLPGGTAYQSDAGMCGDYDSVIGMDKTEPINRFVRKVNTERLSPAHGEATLCGVLVEIDGTTGLAKRAAPVQTGGCLSPLMPDWDS